MLLRLPNMRRRSAASYHTVFLFLFMLFNALYLYAKNRILDKKGYKYKKMGVIMEKKTKKTVLLIAIACITSFLNMDTHTRRHHHVIVRDRLVRDRPVRYRNSRYGWISRHGHWIPRHGYSRRWDLKRGHRHYRGLRHRYVQPIL